MPGIDLQSAVGVNSSDVLEALRQFFSMPFVVPVLGLLIALVLCPLIARALRSMVLDGVSVPSSQVFYEPYGGPSLVSMDEVAPVVGPNLDDNVLDPGLPEIYRGHDPDEFGAIQAASYSEYRDGYD